jgi:ABC-2 type transport system ATP-binding protein
VAIIDHGRLVASGTVDELAEAGARRLTVRVEGERDGTWARSIPGVTVSEVRGSEVRLVLDDATDSDAVLDAARAAGRVSQFLFERRTLSEVFREAVTQ